MPHLCLRCLEKDEPVERLGTMDEYGINGPYCDNCWSSMADADEPDYDAVGITERCDMALRERNDLRRRD